MNHTTDPLHEALDRLAGVADQHPAGDPMPGVLRKARANRRRATALAAGGGVLAVAAGVGLVSVIDLSGPAEDPGFAGSPSPAPSSTPSSPTATPSPSESDLAEYDRGRADVDGDGRPDLIVVRIPEADAAEGPDVSMVSKDVRLEVRLAAGTTDELRFGEVLAPTISGTPDLDGDGADEVVLSFSGGDAAWLRVFTWDGGSVVQAAPAADTPTDLVRDGGLFSAPGSASAALVDGTLLSWTLAEPGPSPFKVRTWTWQLEGTQLVATELQELQCMNPGEYPRPC